MPQPPSNAEALGVDQILVAARAVVRERASRRRRWRRRSSRPASCSPPSRGTRPAHGWQKSPWTWPTAGSPFVSTRRRRPTSRWAGRRGTEACVPVVASAGWPEAEASEQSDLPGGGRHARAAGGVRQAAPAGAVDAAVRALRAGQPGRRAAQRHDDQLGHARCRFEPKLLGVGIEQGALTHELVTAGGVFVAQHRSPGRTGRSSGSSPSRSRSTRRPGRSTASRSTTA